MTARIGILTVSDRASRGEYEDEGGPAIERLLGEILTSPWEPVYRVIPDEQGRIEAAAARSGRDSTDVVLVAVSKGRSRDQILEVYDAGHRDFGENRAEELAEKASSLPDDIVWHSGGNNILTGDYEGKEAVLGYMGRLMQETGGTFRNDVHDMLANDEHGIALITVTGTRGDKTLEGRIVHVFHMRDGKMTEFWAFAEDQAQFDEFWS